MSLGKLAYVSLLLSISLPAHAIIKNGECVRENLSSQLNDAQRSSSQDFASWSPDRLPSVSPEQFLPNEFIDEVQDKMGPVTVVMRERLSDKLRDSLLRHYYQFKLAFSSSSYSSMSMPEIALIRMEMRTQKKRFAEIAFILPRKDPQEVYLSDLELQNPLAWASNKKLHLSQYKKGLPAPVFHFATQKLFEFLRASGASVVFAGPQNYTVSVLYRRLAGFQPRSEKARLMYDYLDKLRKYASQSLPAEVRASSVDDFSRMLGDYSRKPSAKFSEIENVWNNRGKSIPAGITPLYNSDGSMIAILDRRDQHQLTQVYFVNSLAPGHPILSWRTLSNDKDVALSANLTELNLR